MTKKLNEDRACNIKLSREEVLTDSDKNGSAINSAANAALDVCNQAERELIQSKIKLILREAISVYVDGVYDSDYALYMHLRNKFEG